MSFQHIIENCNKYTCLYVFSCNCFKYSRNFCYNYNVMNNSSVEHRTAKSKSLVRSRQIEFGTSHAGEINYVFII